MKSVNIVLLGAGKVGKAFLRMLHEKQKYCLEKYKLNFKIAAVFISEGAYFFPPEKAGAGQIHELYPDYDLQKSFFWHPGLKLEEALRRISPGVLVNAVHSNIESGEPGRSLILEGLRRKWHIVSADKGPLVKELPALREKAREKKVCLKISGATAAALPTLDVALISLAGAEILSIEGILNGTTNYILYRVSAGIDFDTALKEAIGKGIAEPEPAYDLEGWDTAVKILLLANYIFETSFTLSEVRRQGITGLPSEFFKEARRKNKKVKLLGRIEKKNCRILLNVKPEFLQPEHPLFWVDGTEKGIYFKTDTMSGITIAGGKSDPRGAAAAVLKDIINIYYASN